MDWRLESARAWIDLLHKSDLHEMLFNAYSVINLISCFCKVI